MPADPIRQPWPSRMTDRERFVGFLRRQSVDRVPNYEFGYWRENFTAWPIFVDSNITDNHQAHRFFGLDRREDVGGNVWLSPAFPERVIEETADRLILQNAEGLIGEVPKDGHTTIPHFTKASVVTPEDWQCCKAERLRVDDPARRVDVDAIRTAHPEDRDYPLGVNCGSMIGKVRDLLTVEGLAYALADYPEMVEDMVETCCQLVERFLDQVLGRVAFDFASGWEDICCNNGPLVTKAFFRDVVCPRYRRIADRLEAAGIDIWYTDCDGDVRPILDEFLGSGINAMFPFEVNASGHPGELLDRYGERLMVLGGVDKLQLQGGRDAIRAYMESIEPYVRRGGFIPHCDHRCPPTVPPEDYLFYLDLKREMFGQLG